jgi:hypothetical protein
VQCRPATAQRERHRIVMSGGRLALAGRRRERHEARSRIEKPGYAAKSQNRVCIAAM